MRTVYSTFPKPQPAIPFHHHPLAVFRIAGFFFMMLATYGFWRIVQIFLRSDRTRRRWRQRCFAWWSRRMLGFFGVRLSVEGPLPQPPVILVANHLGYLDILALAAILPLRFLSKIEVASWPVLGLMTRSVGTVFIDRSNIKDLPRVTKEMEAVVNGGESLLFFPEGTSHNGEDLLPLRTPLLKLAVEKQFPVVPLGLHYSSTDLRYPAYRDVCWWGNASFLPHFYRFCAIPTKRAYIHFYPESLYATDRKQFARQLHRVITSLTRPT